jgi:hypothetical protein
MLKEFQFKKLIAKKGFFCALRYEASVKTEPQLHFQYKAQEKKWESAAHFAVSYFFEKFSKTNKGLNLIIHEVEWQVVDTSNVVIAYAVLALLSDETGFVVDGLTINDKGELILPK